ncbi:flagella basal body P-ring formation protein FlgA [Ralstonia solanacearum]|nr:flagella basal body P-ring formation protein FlgA [Ralstonia solanacearum]AXV90810.1 flagella basal body P-ring formation protein FlgA [Ralstonia solanacearum]AXW18964.1 flagella basal body P-ring formation protein FlgA [Ralstonia solanacearum]AXW75721.1 flagella basal body P-ring formation protein FlgA [Ralstonia solanacearum]
MPSQLTMRFLRARTMLAIAVATAGAVCPLSNVRAHALPVVERAPLEAEQGEVAATRIDLPAVVEAKRSDVVLGDIAQLASRDLAALRQLMRLPLGRLPRSGESAHLDRFQLARWVRARTGIDPQTIKWSGAEAVDIYLATHELSGEQLATAAKASLQDWLSARSTRSSVELSRVPHDLVVPAGEVKVQVRPISNAALLTRHMSVWVDVWVDDCFIRTVPVSFDVRAYEQGYVMDLAQASGSPLDQIHMQPKEVDLTALPSKAVLTSLKPEAVANLRLRRPMAAGEAVTRDSVESRPAVARGDWATLHAIAGAVNLESRVEVLEDGRNGQLVHVKLPNATSPMLARVVGERMVEVKQ